MKQIKAAIVGYGNIGKYIIESLQAASDFEIVGIVRRDATNVPSELTAYKVVDSVSKLGDVDVALLSVPTRSVEHFAKECLTLGINTVDSFDIHSDILSLRDTLDSVAREHDAVSVISSGWDPGSDSIIRALFESMAPKGITYTNFGPGMSMGHTVAVKAVDGVKDALSMTIPTGTGVHRRMVYIELKDGYDFVTVSQAVKSDDYFIKDETHVFQVENVDILKDMGHGVLMERKGASGNTQNQQFKFDMRVNNPALTAQMMINAARASMRQEPGAYTLIEIPVVDLLQGSSDYWISKLV